MLISVAAVNIVLLLLAYKVWRDRKAEDARRTHMLAMLESCEASLRVLAGRRARGFGTDLGAEAGEAARVQAAIDAKAARIAN